MECDQRFPSQPFVGLTVDQFVEQRKQDRYGGHVFEKPAHCLWFLKL